ncbi:hypothetical protein [Nonomuraea turcica]|uniref:hypothetical protein n=1 Tax=Nonomuraea sp. G32 TaxID=3067274 RepID=UPI00273A9B86|nr:hypothetical protein [Nonomuraea sp. G32]MDP4507557.1 hypothetical protein [Nonomuraea sp. G32]
MRKDVAPPTGLKPLADYTNTDPDAFSRFMSDRAVVERFRSQVIEPASRHLAAARKGDREVELVAVIGEETHLASQDLARESVARLTSIFCYPRPPVSSPLTRASTREAAAVRQQ